MNEAAGQPLFRAGIDNLRAYWHDRIYIMHRLLQIENYRRLAVLVDG